MLDFTASRFECTFAIIRLRSEGTRDFAGMVNEPGTMLEPLRNESWPNGFDIAPEWLRREMEAAGELTRVAAE